jgi:peptidoglycan-associated lipoprotein
MKNFLTLILVGSMLLAGCAQKTVTSDLAMEEAAPASSQETTMLAWEEAGSAPPVAAVAPEAEETDERLADKIFFAVNSHLLTTASKKALEGHANWLQIQPEVRIIIEGHADERGSDKYNLALAKRRAQAARDYLVTLGIAPERLTTISYGREKATKGAATEIIWAHDRRAEFVAAN